jgi:hypothetical protein
MGVIAVGRLINVCDHFSIFQPGSHRPSGRHLRAHVREPHRGATVSGETTEQHCRARGPYRGSPPSRSETTTQVGAGGFQPHRAALRGHLRGGKGRSSWGIGFTSCCAPGPSRGFVQPERGYNASWASRFQPLRSATYALALGSHSYALAFSRVLREARTPTGCFALGDQCPPESTSGSRRVHVRCSSRASTVLTFPVSFSQTDLRSPSTF